MTSEKSRREATRIAHAGRDPSNQYGYVNPPVVRGSTRLYPTLAEYDASYTAGRRYQDYAYGRIQTPTSHAFEQAVAELEGGYRAVVASSGLGAVTTAVLAFAKAGDHALVVDNVYGPTRAFFDGTMRRLGVEVTYFAPDAGSGIAGLIRPNTRIVFLEAPGSLTFEMCDVPAIAAAAHAAGAVVLMDNTWGTPLYFKSFEHGVDVSIHAATKYIVGHSDAMLGVAVCTRDSYRPVKDQAVALGQWAGPDDMYLGLRGLRTMGVRLAQHWKNGIAVAEWLQTRPEVERVLHPALPSDPGHAIWKRDFKGACGLFGVVLKPCPVPAVAAMVDGLELFGIGASWGGYESLVQLAHPEKVRTAKPWTAKGPLLRFHIGLEDIEDLKADLARGFDRLNAACARAAE
ncbi:MAG TPA: cystathionine beta-lyase [Azospirillaceae bacterium]|nr:cystathionine beta-lyase [Azospirillaceae bacterium]